MNFMRTHMSSSPASCQRSWQRCRRLNRTGLAPRRYRIRFLAQKLMRAAHPNWLNHPIDKLAGNASPPERSIKRAKFAGTPKPGSIKVDGFTSQSADPSDALEAHRRTAGGGQLGL